MPIRIVDIVDIVLFLGALIAASAIFPGLFGAVINPVQAKIWTHPEMLEDLLLFALLSAAVYAGAIKWYRKTFLLVLNLEQRTYRTMDVVGGNLRPKTGTWDDIAGICVRRASARGSIYYLVQLKWREQAKLAGNLGGFSKPDRAESFAAQMARELSLPVMES